MPEAVAKLKEVDGGPIVIAGSRTLVHSLIPTGLIDEYRLMIFPVAVGSGARIWPDSPDKLVLELADTQEVRLRRCRERVPPARCLVLA